MAYKEGDYKRRGGARALKIPYVRTRFGRPEYRRRVPEWLQPILNLTEWTEKLPRDQEGTLRRAAALTRKYDRMTAPEIRRLVPLGTKEVPKRTLQVKRSDGRTYTAHAPDVEFIYDTIHTLMQEPLTADGMPDVDDVLSLPADEMRMLLSLRRVVEKMAANDAVERERLRPLIEAVKGVETQAPEDTLGDVVSRWLKATKYPQSTKDTYDSRVRRALEFFGPDLPVKNLTFDMVRDWRDQVVLLPGPTGLPSKLRTASMRVLLQHRLDNPDTTKPILPHSVRDHLKALQACLSWALGERIINTNPAAGVKPPKDERDIESTRQPALPWREIPAFMAAVRHRPEPLARAIEFAVLCASRTSEVTGMDWAEVDLTGKIWTCPASRVKGSREAHIVPLSGRAVELLGQRGEGRVFGTIPANGLLRFIQRQMGRPEITTHGFRSAFSTWAHERTEFPTEMIEIAQAHKVGTAVSRRYRRELMVERRRAMMEDWATFCMSPGST